MAPKGGPSGGAILASEADIAGNERNSPIVRFSSKRSKVTCLFLGKQTPRQWEGVGLVGFELGGLGHS